jgi:hypothetical protein
MVKVGTSQFSKSARESTFAAIIDAEIQENSNALNIIDFLDSPLGPPVTLYPVQRIIAKAIYGVPMDYKPVKVPVYDKHKEKLLFQMSETEFVNWLASEGRINVKDWRDLPARGFNEAVILAGRRGGKAFGINEEIPTPEGFKRIGDLVDGDTVFGPDGLPTQVIYAHPSFIDQTYRVTFDDGTSVVCHGGHLWHTYTKADRKALGRRIDPKGAKRPNSCKNSNPTGAVRTTEEIRDTLKIERPDGKSEANHSIPLPDAVQLPEAPLQVEPYLLGQWLGDGRSSDTSIATVDPETVEFIGHQGLPDENPLRTALRAIGVWENKHIPQSYLWASAPQRLALLQGLMDSNGCCVRSRCDFTHTNEALARGVYHLAASLGLKPYWGEGRAALKGKDCGPKFRVTWTGMLPVFRLPRKLATLPKEVNTSQTSRFIVSIEPEEVREVRCITVAHKDGLFLFGRNFNVTHNSQLVSALACYKLYRLLSIRNPQEHYGLVDGSVIDFTFLAQDEDGAQRLYTKMRQDVNQASFFSPYQKSGTGTSRMQFVTESDRGKRDVLPSINVESHPCTTRSARGPSAIFLAFDEFAHFRSATGSSSDEVYEAASPAVANFVNPNDGSLDSLIVSITSPWTRVGKLWSLWQDAMQVGVDSGVFAIRVASVEMNPGVPKEILTKALRTSPLTWNAEYGGEFLDSSESFVSNADLLACVDTGRKNVFQFSPALIGKHYFWGLDLGFKKDASALAICHWEYNEEGTLVLVYDYVGRMMVGEAPYEHAVELPVNDVFKWLSDMNTLMPGCKGATDQHGGSMFTQMAHQLGLGFMDLVHFTSGLNSQMYYVLKGFINQRTIRFPDEPLLMTELQTLEATYTGKYSIKVEAPPEKNAHDDQADAVALSAWLANNWLLGEGKRYLGDASIAAMMTPDMVSQGMLLPDLDSVPLTSLRLMERQRNMTGMASNPEGGMLSPRLSMRRR